jgi:hypothetical protein
MMMMMMMMIQSSRICWYDHVKRIQNQKKKCQKTATATFEATKKKGRPHKRGRDEVEEDLYIMGIKKTGRKWPETVGNGERLYGKPRSTTDCNASTRKKKC